jgi:[ribosomal protein S5]-alanine N-acetyltransferase
MDSVHITPPTPSDCHAFLDAVNRSRPLHGAWVSPPATAAAFDAYLQRTARDDQAAFFIRLNDSDAIAGVVNLSQIVGEPLSSGYLGFYALEPFARQGFMKAGLRLVLEHVFGPLGLHRVEANIQPANSASIGLVRACGFRKEGLSLKYLQIAGQWRDHERWALLAEEFRASERVHLPEFPNDAG